MPRERRGSRCWCAQLYPRGWRGLAGGIRPGAHGLRSLSRSVRPCARDPASELVPAEHPGVESRARSITCYASHATAHDAAGARCARKILLRETHSQRSKKEFDRPMRCARRRPRSQGLHAADDSQVRVRRDDVQPGSSSFGNLSATARDRPKQPAEEDCQSDPKVKSSALREDRWCQNGWAGTIRTTATDIPTT